MDTIITMLCIAGVAGIVTALLSCYIAIFKDRSLKRVSRLRVFRLKGVRVGLTIFYVSLILGWALTIIKVFIKGN